MNDKYSMRKNFLVFLSILPIALLAQPAPKGESGLKLLDSEKVFSWMSKEGQKIRDNEITRLKLETGKPDFIRNELLALYFDIQSDLAFQRAYFTFLFTKMGSEEFATHSKAIKIEIREKEELALRLLEILSKMPAANSEEKKPRK